MLCRANNWTGGEGSAAAAVGQQWHGTLTGQAVNLTGWQCSHEAGSHSGGAAHYKELAAKLGQRRRERDDQNKPLDKSVMDLEAEQKRKQAQVQPPGADAEEAKEALEKAPARLSRWSLLRSCCAGRAPGLPEATAERRTRSSNGMGR